MGDIRRMVVWEVPLVSPLEVITTWTAIIQQSIHCMPEICTMKHLKVHAGTKPRDGWKYRGEATEVFQEPLLGEQSHNITRASLSSPCQHPSRWYCWQPLVAGNRAGISWTWNPNAHHILPSGHTEGTPTLPENTGHLPLPTENWKAREV